MQGVQLKCQTFCFRIKNNTCHGESNCILQSQDHLIIAAHQFIYIICNFTNDRCPIPKDMTVVLGLHKFSLQATIEMIDSKHSSTAIVVIYINWLRDIFEIEQGDGSSIIPLA